MGYDNKIPRDNAMLLSYINTKLRDEFESLDELCSALGLDRGQIEESLRALGYEYEPAQNKFL